MIALFACKLYKASPNKAKIRAALADPVNMELVQQLKEYLDPVYTEPFPVEVHTEAQSEEGEGATKMRSSSGGGAGGGGFGSSGEFGDTPEGEDLGDDTLPGEIPDDALEDEEEELEPEIASSKKVKGKPIQAQTALYEAPIAGAGVQLEGIPAATKGLLNAQDTTSHVSRVLLKDNELWIYYEDSINLNNVMSSVIELLNAANYYYLDFNRLARSDNAMVFQINLIDTEADVAEGEKDDED